MLVFNYTEWLGPLPYFALGYVLLKSSQVIQLLLSALQCLGKGGGVTGREVSAGLAMASNPELRVSKDVATSSADLRGSTRGDWQILRSIGKVQLWCGDLSWTSPVQEEERERKEDWEGKEDGKELECWSLETPGRRKQKQQGYFSDVGNIRPHKCCFTHLSPSLSDVAKFGFPWLWQSWQEGQRYTITSHSYCLFCMFPELVMGNSVPYNSRGGNDTATCGQLWDPMNSAQEWGRLTSMPCYVNMANFLPGCLCLCMDKRRYSSLPGAMYPCTHSTMLPCPSEHTLHRSFMHDVFTFFVGSIFCIASSSWTQNPSHRQPVPLNVLQESSTTSVKISQASHWLLDKEESKGLLLFVCLFVFPGSEPLYENQWVASLYTMARANLFLSRHAVIEEIAGDSGQFYWYPFGEQPMIRVFRGEVPGLWGWYLGIPEEDQVCREQ